MSKHRKDGRQRRYALKEMQRKSIVYALRTVKTKRDYTSAKRIGV